MKKETLEEAIKINKKIDYFKDKIDNIEKNILSVSKIKDDLLFTGNLFSQKEDGNEGVFIDRIKGVRSKAYLSMLIDEKIYNEENLIRYAKKLEDLKDD